MLLVYDHYTYYTLSLRGSTLDVRFYCITILILYYVVLLIIGLYSHYNKAYIKNSTLLILPIINYNKETKWIITLAHVSPCYLLWIITLAEVKTSYLLWVITIAHASTCYLLWVITLAHVSTCYLLWVNYACTRFYLLSVVRLLPPDHRHYSCECQRHCHHLLHPRCLLRVSALPTSQEATRQPRTRHIQKAAIPA